MKNTNVHQVHLLACFFIICSVFIAQVCVSSSLYLPNLSHVFFNTCCCLLSWYCLWCSLNQFLVPRAICKDKALTCNNQRKVIACTKWSCLPGYFSAPWVVNFPCALTAGNSVLVFVLWTDALSRQVSLHCLSRWNIRATAPALVDRKCSLPRLLVKIKIRL